MPYSNGLHIFVGSAFTGMRKNTLTNQVRYKIRRSSTTLLIVPSRDRGIYRTDFTLEAFASFGSDLRLTRINQSLPFTQLIPGSLTTRNAGGNPGWPSWMQNPQYKLVISSPPSRIGQGVLRVLLNGDKALAWNAKVLWGTGELVHE
jgi:calpain-7